MQYHLANHLLTAKVRRVRVGRARVRRASLRHWQKDRATQEVGVKPLVSFCSSFLCVLKAESFQLFIFYFKEKRLAPLMLDTIFVGNFV